MKEGTHRGRDTKLIQKDITKSKEMIFKKLNFRFIISHSCVTVRFSNMSKAPFVHLKLDWIKY